MNFKNVTAILLLKALFIGALIVWGPIGLGPDEAQYWTWSLHLDWGYFSKPPGIAWQIWSGTALFGDTEFGVRFGALVLGLALPCSVYLLAKDATGSSKTGLIAAIVMALSPLGILASFLAITDTGLAVFWTLATWTIAEALHEDREPNYYFTGCMIALAALFKWPAYAFWLIILGMYPFYQEIRSRKLSLGIAISLLGLAPSVYWNSGHDWASFRHVLATLLGYQVQGGQALINTNSNFFEFLGAQAALLSPILFILLIASLVGVLRRKQPTAIQFLAINCFSILALCLTLSLFKKIQGNWGSYAYPSGVVLLVWFAIDQWRRGIAWLQVGVATSLILVATILSIPTLQLFGLPIPYKLNPFRHNVGWKELNQALIERGYDPKKHFLVGDKYQTTSILSFYGPGQKRAYFLNLQGTRKNQFSYWPTLAEEHLNGDGFFIFYENCEKPEECIEHYKEQLKPYFKSVKFLTSVPIFSVNNRPEKFVYIFETAGYNGKEPVNFDLY